MHFLPDVYVTCDVCHGHRYNRDTLEVKYKGKNIADVLEMTVEEALGFFDGIPRIKNKLQTIYDVGLGYIKIGQSSTTLSGGEAQKIALARALYKNAPFIILDEPTVSRLHAVVVCSKDGWYVADVRSQAGVRLNGKHIEKKEYIKTGDAITLGAVTLFFENLQN